MIKKFSLLSILLIFMLVVVGCNMSDNSNHIMTWQEQYDLGIRFLAEERYSEAIVAFTSAIEIDPKQVPAYLSLADAYIAIGDRDSAIETLQKAVSTCGETENLMIKLREIQDNVETAEATDTYDMTPANVLTSEAVTADELTLGGIPFWELTVSDVAALFPDGEYLNLRPDDSREAEYDASTYGENGGKYSCFRASLDKGKKHLYISYVGFLDSDEDAALGYRTELRNIRCGQSRESVLRTLGFTEDAITEIEGNNYSLYLDVMKGVCSTWDTQGEHSTLQIELYHNELPIEVMMNFMGNTLELIDYWVRED